MKSPSGGGGDTPMERFPFLVTTMKLDLFQRCQQTKRFWGSSGMNFLSLLHCFSSVVSPGQIYGNISRYWWIYFSIRSLVRGIRFSCAVYVGVCGFLWI